MLAKPQRLCYNGRHIPNGDPYHVIGAQEIMAIINDDEKEAPENDEADAHVSSSFACYIRRTMCTLAHKSYLAICQALNRGRKIFMETT